MLRLSLDELEFQPNKKIEIGKSRILENFSFRETDLKLFFLVALNLSFP